MITLNMGNTDRVLRFLLGVVLIVCAAVGFIGPWGYAGIVLAITGAVAYCPLYHALGIRTTSR